MRRTEDVKKFIVAFVAFTLSLGWLPAMAMAQNGQDQAPPPSFGPGQLDGLVTRIALYPPLLRDRPAGRSLCHSHYAP
jgi:hypothetical protein